MIFLHALKNPFKETDICPERCSFTEVCTDREDLKLFRCEELRGKLLRRTRVYDMVDRESCSGLEAIEQLIPGTDEDS